MQREIRRFGWFLTAWIVLTFPLEVLAGAGGTGDDDGGGIGLILLILLLPAIIGYTLYKTFLYWKAKEDAWEVLQDASSADPAWRLSGLKETAESVFRTLQRHWSNNDLEACREYLHPSYEQEFRQKLQTSYIDLGRHNRIASIDIEEVDIVVAKNYRNDDRDVFVAFFEGRMDDWVENEEGEIIEKNGDGKDSERRSIDEYWYFRRSGDRWLVQDITEKHSALYEVSFDKENWPKNREEVADLDRDFADHLEELQLNKKLYIAISGLAGIAVTAIGYALYGWLGYAIYQSL